ncbi:MAG: hypothetical protein PHX62_01770, partial [Bacilli bacterium]|nr:hypothetical protein [Bacilli bacterium]
IRISRELYSLGYYNPSDENRPNPDNFKYGDEDFSEDDTPKKNNVYFYLGGFLLVIVAMIFTFMKARERENL